MDHHSYRSLSFLAAFPLEEGSDFLLAAGSQEGGVQAHASKSSPDLSPTVSLQPHPIGQVVPAPAPTQHSTSLVTPLHRHDDAIFLTKPGCPSEL